MNNPFHPDRTVVVTSANSRVGRLLLPYLTQNGFQTTALVRSPTELPATRTISNWMEATEAMEAMQNSDAIVHLSGELFAQSAKAYREANVQTTERVLEALQSGCAKRVVFISYLGANPQSPNLFLKAKGQAEQLLLGSKKEAVIFRAQAIINPPNAPSPFEENLVAPEGKKVSILGDGQQKIEVVYISDVVEAITKALDSGRPGVYDLKSPDRLTLDDLVKLLNRNPNVAISHIPAWLARVLGRLMPDLSPTVVDLFLHDYPRMDSKRTVAEFGLTMTSLHEIWQA